MPVQVDDFEISTCDGLFAGDTPFLKEGDTFLLKPDVPCKIGTYMGGQKRFIPDYVLMREGVPVELDRDGNVLTRITFPVDK